MANHRFPLGPRVRIHVQKEHITNAITANSSKCWIAEAIKAQVPNSVNVAVDVATTRYTDPVRGLRYVYLTPYSAQKALLDFDEGTPPPPFSFVLKNAHVTRAGSLPATIERRKKAQTKQAQARQERKKAVQAQLAKAQLVANHAGRGSVPRRVGGKRPPQLRMMRQFGVRAFRGASKARLDADAAAVARAEAQH